MRRALVFTAFAGLAYLHWQGVPYGWMHDLTPTCHWKAQKWPRTAGLESWGIGPAEQAAQWRCERSRGAHDPEPIPTLKVLLRTFPTEAELTAWNGEPDANRRALPARQ